MRVICRLTGLALGAMLAVSSGCGSSLPTHRWNGHSEAMNHLVARGDAIETVSGTCTVYLQHDGGGASLDAALALRQGGYLRLRAWKFNHAAFDVTMTPDGLWLLTGDDDDTRRTSLQLEHVASAWSLLSGAYFQTAAQVRSSRTEHIVIGRGADDSVVRCTIDRRTLTPLRFEYLDETGIARAALNLDRHRVIDGHIWPMRMTFLADDARIVIVMREMQINQQVPDAAFRPPARAVRQP